MAATVVLEWVTALGTLVTAGAAVFAVVVAMKLEGRVLDIEEERRKDERARAVSGYITAEIERRKVERFDKHDVGYFLRLKNLGDAQARNVEVGVVGPDGEPVSFLQDADDLPVRAMDPGGTYPIMLVPAMGDHPVMHVHLSWVDATGVRANEIQLSYL